MICKWMAKKHRTQYQFWCWYNHHIAISFRLEVWAWKQNDSYVTKHAAHYFEQLSTAQNIQLYAVKTTKIDSYFFWNRFNSLVENFRYLQFVSTECVPFWYINIVYNVCSLLNFIFFVRHICCHAIHPLCL